VVTVAFDVSELVTLYDISHFDLSVGQNDFFEELTEKAARLFGVRRMSLFLLNCEEMECLGYWGFKSKTRALQAINKQADNIYKSFFPGNAGVLYMEQQNPLTARDKKLYNIFARRVEDYVKRLKAEKDLKIIEERSRSIVEAIPDLLFRYGVDGTCLDIWCKEGEQKLYSPFDKVIGKKVKDVLPGDIARLFAINIRKAVRQCQLQTFEYILPGLDGQTRFFEARIVKSGLDEVIAFIRDITENKQAEAEKNRKAEQTIRFQVALLELGRLKKDTLLETLRAITEIGGSALGVDRVGIWLFNEERSEMQCADLYLINENKHTNGHPIRLKDHPEYHSVVENSRIVAVEDVSGDKRFRDAGKKKLALMGVVSLLDAPIRLRGEVAGIIGYEQVSKKRKWTEDEQQFAASVAETISLVLETFARRKDREMLEKREKRLRLITENMLDMVSEVDANGRCLYVSPSHTRLLGYQRYEMLGNPFHHLVHPDDRDRVLNTVRESFKTRLPGKIEYRHRHADGSYLWVESVGNMITDGNGNITGAVFGTRDITERKAAEEELKATVVRLKLTITGIIKAMERTVEMRDPYTAGHQQRVSELAAATAIEMGLSQETVEGIRLAASIHDLGKITVPAEILAKPGKINDIEINLIRLHPVVGYDILNKIDFPWPIAAVVYQHHERLDGSGYPRGLKGEEILLEARILGVADVVEAMASHRPYRPALGLKDALSEISGGSGTRYDPQVVEACLRVCENNSLWQ
jgi:PAS domain S-box-containing protein